MRDRQTDRQTKTENSSYSKFVTKRERERTLRTLTLYPRGRERERDRQTKTRTETERDRENSSYSNFITQRERERETGRQAGKQTYIQRQRTLRTENLSPRKTGRELFVQ